MGLFAEVFSMLNGHRCRYVVVGGLAAVLHGHSRMTADIDLAVDLDTDEAAKVLRALEELGMQPRMPVDFADFLSPEARRQWKTDKNMIVFSLHHPDNPLLSVDLFIENPIAFAELWERAEEMTLDGLSLKVASISDLIRLKQMAGRAQDLQDIAYLEKILNERQ